MKKVFLVLYYLIGFYLPMQPFPGYKIFYSFRFFLCKRILNSCGKEVIIKDRAYFGNGDNLRVGDFSQLGQNCKLGGPIELGSNVMMGPDVVIMAVTHDVSDLSKPMNDSNNPSIVKPVKVGNNVWIGTRVIIMPGVTIGNNCIIGAGSVVTKSFADNSIIAGVPAKKIKNRV